MLKTISAALLGVAILAAPVLAATPAKKAQAPVAATAQAPAAKTAQAPVINADRTRSKAMNAKAKMQRHHIRHGKTSVLKKHSTPKVAIKQVTPAKPAKRG